MFYNSCQELAVAFPPLFASCWVITAFRLIAGNFDAAHHLDDIVGSGKVSDVAGHGLSGG